MYLFLKANDIKYHEIKHIEYVGLRITKDGKRTHMIKLEW